MILGSHPTQNSTILEGAKDGKAGNPQQIENRTLFTKGEILPIKEGLTVEYKEFYGAFINSWKLMNTLQRTVCAFLNKAGGNIYIGVKDDPREVVGIELTDKQEDKVCNALVTLFSEIYPAVISTKKPLVHIIPIPLYDQKLQIKNSYVLKIQVSRGNRANYCILKSYIRYAGSCMPLLPDEIIDSFVHERKSYFEEELDTNTSYEDYLDDTDYGQFSETIDESFATETIEGESSEVSLLESKAQISKGPSSETGKAQLITIDNKMAESPKEKSKENPPSDGFITVGRKGSKKPKNEEIKEVLNSKEEYGYKLSNIHKDTRIEKIRELFRGYDTKPILEKFKPDSFNPELVHIFINFKTKTNGDLAVKKIDGKEKLNDRILRLWPASKPLEQSI